MRRFLRNTKGVIKRELTGYFGSPVAYVFIVIFLMLCGFFTFSIAQFYELGQADLRAFFQWHPWIFLFLVPAVAMRLWADERRTGTIELILTLPITLTEVIVGKFLAAWLFLGLALFMTFPLVLTVIYLGDPDMGSVICGYIGSLLLAGAFLSVGSMTSSLTRTAPQRSSRAMPTAGGRRSSSTRRLRTCSRRRQSSMWPTAAPTNPGRSSHSTIWWSS